VQRHRPTRQTSAAAAAGPVDVEITGLTEIGKNRNRNK